MNDVLLSPLRLSELENLIEKSLERVLRKFPVVAPPDTARWVDIEELRQHLPDNPAITTIYGMVQRREIPFARRGRKLIFFLPDIDNWLAGKKSKTSADLSLLADQRISNRTARRKGGAA
jgi:hypothetical protein